MVKRLLIIFFMGIVTCQLSYDSMGDQFWTIDIPSQSALTCSRLTIETLVQGVKYVQS